MSDMAQGPGWWQASDGKWYPPQGAGAGQFAAAPKTSGLAIASLITGILSILACPVFGIVGLITGFMAKKSIRESNGAETGDGLATGGIVTSLIGVVLIGLAFVAIFAVTFLGTAASSKFSSVAVAIPN
jgi:hypothetical protein